MHEKLRKDPCQEGGGRVLPWQAKGTKKENLREICIEMVNFVCVGAEERKIPDVKPARNHAWTSARPLYRK